MFVRYVILSLSLLWVNQFVLAQTEMIYPLDVAVGPDDSIYVADRKLPGIWKIVDKKPEIFFKGSKTFRTPLNAVRCLAVDEDGTVYAGDSSTREVYAFDADKKPVPLTDGYIGIAADLIIDGENIIVSDLETQRIWKFPKEGGKPEEVALMAAVRGLAKDQDDRLICVTTLENPVRHIKSDGKTEVIIKDRPFEMPHHCAIVENHIFVADNYANTIWKTELKTGAKPEAFVKGSPMQKPVGLCRYKDGFLIADPHAKQIFQIDGEGKVTSIVSK